MTVKRSFWGVFLFYNPYKHYENENKCKTILYINLFVVDLLYQITIKTKNIMSVTSQIKNDWKLAIEKALPPKIIDRTNQIQIAIDCRGNEYFIHDDTGNEKTFRVTRPDGINCSVWKKGFRLRWVDSDYCLKPIVW